MSVAQRYHFNRSYHKLRRYPYFSSLKKIAGKLKYAVKTVNSVRMTRHMSTRGTKFSGRKIRICTFLLSMSTVVNQTHNPQMKSLIINIKLYLVKGA